MSDNLEMASGLQIIDDNPATLDLLGFDAVWLLRSFKRSAEAHARTFINGRA